MTDGVVLLHGIFRSSKSMKHLADALQTASYAVLNLDYPSTRYPLESLIEIIHPQIVSFAAGLSGQLHFVGFSMGGLLTRAYLSKYHPEKLGRVVMLGTPNKGSEVADFLQNRWLFRKLYGPAGQQLITNQQAFHHVWKAVDYELGIIAGNRTIDPISSWIIGQPNDGKVSIESTKLAEMKDHIVVPATHTFFPQNKEAQSQTLRFLQTGQFLHKH